MHWKMKALVQNAVAALPSGVGYELYFALQRRFGALRSVDPFPTLLAGLEVVARARAARDGRPVRHAVEVGTGRRLNLPFALWLSGTERVTTVDLHPYLADDLVHDDLVQLRRRERELVELLTPYVPAPELERRLALLHDWGGRGGRGGRDALARLGIEYHAPADAARLALPDASIDLHVSYNVFEHIPPTPLASILAEGARVLRPDGVAVHRVDFSDHFSHGDDSLSSVNFLRFDDRTWSRYAGNRYMYQSRLRVTDYTRLFASSGLAVTSLDAAVDDRAEGAIASGALPVSARFAGNPPRVNATTDAWFVARRGRVDVEGEGDAGKEQVTRT